MSLAYVVFDSSCCTEPFANVVQRFYLLRRQRSSDIFVFNMRYNMLDSGGGAGIPQGYPRGQHFPLETIENTYEFHAKLYNNTAKLYRSSRHCLVTAAVSMLVADVAIMTSQKRVAELEREVEELRQRNRSRSRGNQSVSII